MQQIWQRRNITSFWSQGHTGHATSRSLPSVRGLRPYP
jgi:hypothetical protein